MTTQEIADRLVQLCREGKWEQAQAELYADDAISVEPYDSPGFQKETKGLAAIKKKGEDWMNMTEEFHGLTVSDPMIGGNSFSLVMDMDVTMKQRGRNKMSELCVYETKDGKIISERFFV